MFYIVFRVAHSMAGAFQLSALALTGLSYASALALFMVPVALYAAVSGFRAITYTDTLRRFGWSWAS